MSNEQNCILRDVCKLAGTESCTKLCPHFVSLHGASGTGGRVGSNGVPTEYRRFTVADNPVRESQTSAYKLLDKYAATFTRMFTPSDEPSERVKNVYLWSRASGTGKTATASALANTWQVVYYAGSIQRQETPDDDAIYFFDVAEFHQVFTEFARPHIPAEIAEAASRRYYKMMARAKEADFVVMDDIGEGRATDAFRRDMHAIIHHRYRKSKPTVYTSNLPMDELKDLFDEKLYDRVRDLTIEIPFTGESKRGKRK